MNIHSIIMSKPDEFQVSVRKITTGEVPEYEIVLGTKTVIRLTDVEAWKLINAIMATDQFAKTESIKNNEEASHSLIHDSLRSYNGNF